LFAKDYDELLKQYIAEVDPLVEDKALLEKKYAEIEDKYKELE